MIKAIAPKLYISPHTVSRHLRNISKKLHARNTVHLICILNNITRFSKPHASLTVTENQIMNLLISGLTSYEIAEMLDISYYTIRSHRENILQKLGVNNTRQAAIQFLFNRN